MNDQQQQEPDFNYKLGICTITDGTGVAYRFPKMYILKFTNKNEQLEENAGYKITKIDGRKIFIDLPNLEYFNFDALVKLADEVINSDKILILKDSYLNKEVKGFTEPNPGKQDKYTMNTYMSLFSCVEGKNFFNAILSTGAVLCLVYETITIPQDISVHIQAINSKISDKSKCITTKKFFTFKDEFNDNPVTAIFNLFKDILPHKSIFEPFKIKIHGISKIQQLIEQI